MAKIPAQLFESISPPPSLLSTEPNSPHNFPNYVPFQRPKQSPQPLDSVSHLTNNYHLSSLYTKPINSTGYASVLDSCNSQNLGTQVHAHAIKTGFHCHDFVQTKLLQMYAKFGCLECAHLLFDSVPLRNLHSWLAILNVYFDHGLFDEAFSLFQELLFEDIELEFFAFPLVFKICSGLGMVELGRQLHAMVMKRCGDMDNAVKIFSRFSLRNEVSYNTMIVGYCAIGDVSKAKEFFDQMEVSGVKRERISWNSMISGYVDNFMFDEALNMFRNLLKEGIEPDSFTLGSVLTACADTASLRQGKEIHSYAIVKSLQSNTFVGGALIEMYSKCQDPMAAQLVFNEVIERDAPTWNVLISCYARCNQNEEIRNLLQKMQEDGFEPNIYTWNGILAGYVENGHLDLAMQLFSEMHTGDVRPDIFTVGIILPACSKLATLERGKQVHAHSIRCYYDSDVHIGAGLVDMYAKCGSLQYAQLAYSRISNHNLVCHNVMLTAYAMHGYGEEGIALFRTIRATGFQPDNVTFLSVLASCVHAGLVEHENTWILYHFLRPDKTFNNKRPHYSSPCQETANNSRANACRQNIIFSDCSNNLLEEILLRHICKGRNVILFNSIRWAAADFALKACSQNQEFLCSISNFDSVSISDFSAPRTLHAMALRPAAEIYPTSGGAERLIVDASVQLASHGQSVHIFTAHHDNNRCFEENLARTFFSTSLINLLLRVMCGNSGRPGVTGFLCDSTQIILLGNGETHSGYEDGKENG
ncbi:pentatricopeptide repeat-containing protein, putative [Ricinus communis]|uniref:Pentatricopeptide repeat-containing protein, putative n=1 Tax=Ricinus communis TaxID=3988 RepID=B9RPH6_RICCO|nr:pentatricopeptide repeat-containing protein, putative [Ricinus communis]